MDIIGRNKLDAFTKKHADCRKPIASLLRDLEENNFNDIHELSDFFPQKVRLDKDTKYILFNIGGNKYRLYFKVLFNRHKMRVIFIGTHAEYDKYNKL